MFVVVECKLDEHHHQHHQQQQHQQHHQHDTAAVDAPSTLRFEQRFTPGRTFYTFHLPLHSGTHVIAATITSTSCPLVHVTSAAPVTVTAGEQLPLTHPAIALLAAAEKCDTLPLLRENVTLAPVSHRQLLAMQPQRVPMAVVDQIVFNACVPPRHHDDGCAGFSMHGDWRGRNN